MSFSVMSGNINIYVFQGSEETWVLQGHLGIQGMRGNRGNPDHKEQKVDLSFNGLSVFF